MIENLNTKQQFEVIKHFVFTCGDNSFDMVEIKGWISGRVESISLKQYENDYRVLDKNEIIERPFHYSFSFKGKSGSLKWITVLNEGNEKIAYELAVKTALHRYPKHRYYGTSKTFYNIPSNMRNIGC